MNELRQNHIDHAARSGELLIKHAGVSVTDVSEEDREVLFKHISKIASVQERLTTAAITTALEQVPMVGTFAMDILSPILAAQREPLIAKMTEAVAPSRVQEQGQPQEEIVE